AGQRSRKPMVMGTSDDCAVSQSSLRGVLAVMSMPTSRIAATATGLIWSAGSLPAERTSTVSPARWRSQPAAIWERPALCTHTNRTVGLLLIGRVPPTVAGQAGIERGCAADVGDDDVVG